MSEGERGEEVRLARELTLFDATMLGLGALMGGGVFVLLGLAAGVAGPAVLLAFFLNGLVTIPTLMVYAELGGVYHDAGGGYLWVKDAMRQPLGFLGGWISWFAHAVACALYSIAAVSYVTWLTDHFGWTHFGNDVGFALKLGAVGAAAFFVVLNYLGVKISFRTENTINVIVFAGVAVFILAGLWDLAHASAHVRANFTPFFTGGAPLVGLSATFLAMGITFISFEGYEIIAQASEEVQNPGVNIPRAHWLTLWIIWPIYLLVVLITVGVPHAPAAFAHVTDWLGAEKEQAVVEAASQVLPYGAYLIVSCALLLQLVALNATIYSSSRVSFAMGRDQNLPSALARVHPKRRTPHVAIWVSGFIIMTMAILPIEAVASASDIMFLLLFTLVNASFIKLRNTLPPETFTYRAPFFPYMPLIGIATKGFLAIWLYKYEPLGWYAAGVWLLVGLAFYYVWVHPREATREAAKAKEAVALETTAPTRKAYRILLPVANPATAEPLARIAARIAEGLDAEIHLLSVVTVPEVTPLTEGRRFVDDALPILHAAERAIGGRVPVHSLVRIGHDVSATIHEVAEEKGASLLLLGWSGTGRIHDRLVGSAMEPLVEFPPCDLALVKLRGDGRNLARVLVPTHGGTHAPLAVKLGSAIARSTLGQALVYNVAPPAEETTMEARRARGLALITGNAVAGSFTELRIERAEDPVERVVDRAKWAEIVIVGATTEPAWRNYLFGHKSEAIADGVPGTVLLVKAHPGPAAHRARGLTRRLRSLRGYLRPAR